MLIDLTGMGGGGPVGMVPVLALLAALAFMEPLKVADDDDGTRPCTHNTQSVISHSLLAGQVVIVVGMHE